MHDEKFADRPVESWRCDICRIGPSAEVPSHRGCTTAEARPHVDIQSNDHRQKHALLERRRPPSSWSPHAQTPASRIDSASAACGMAVEEEGSSRRTDPSAAETALAAPGCRLPALQSCLPPTWTSVTGRSLISASDVTRTACPITAALC